MFHRTGELNAVGLRFVGRAPVIALVVLMICSAAIAYSNYEGGTGNVDVLEIALSFNVGLSDKAHPVSVAHPIEISCIKFDEYPDLKFNDEKARLDNFAIQLQQMPRAQGYYVIFGSCDGEADERSQRVVDYLVSYGIDRDRIAVTNGGCRETLTTELWICPKGTPTPIPSNLGTVNPCPKCKARPKPRRRGRRHHQRSVALFKPVLLQFSLVILT